MFPDNLAKSALEKRELEKTIVDTEHAKAKVMTFFMFLLTDFKKIVESFRTILSVLQKESAYHGKTKKTLNQDDY